MHGIQENVMQQEYNEFLQVFHLLRLDTQLAAGLRSIPEYRDYFDHNTGFVEIIGVIGDGVFRHVLNCLKISRDLEAEGVFNIPGIARPTANQALVFHDIGKEPPRLKVGDIIDPETCFPDGKIHAGKSASIIAAYPSVPGDVVTLVKYHHHQEVELPGSFPARLLPMLRLIKLIDGLSAGITRKNAQLIVTAEGSKITVYEKNPDPVYRGVQELDLISGEVMFERF